MRFQSAAQTGLDLSLLGDGMVSRGNHAALHTGMHIISAHLPVHNDSAGGPGEHSGLIWPRNHGPPLGQRPEQVHVHLPAAYLLITTP